MSYVFVSINENCLLVKVFEKIGVVLVFYWNLMFSIVCKYLKITIWLDQLNMQCNEKILSCSNKNLVDIIFKKWFLCFNKL